MTASIRSTRWECTVGSHRCAPVAGAPLDLVPPGATACRMTLMTNSDDAAPIGVIGSEHSIDDPAGPVDAGAADA
jgi:hypothetical protein